MEANCYVRREESVVERWQVCDSESHAVLATLPELGRGNLRFFTDRTAATFKAEVNVRERLFVLPSSAVYAVVPRTNNEIIIQRFQLDAQPSVPLEPISPPTLPPAAEAPKHRTWTDASGKFQVEAMLVSRDANQVRLQRKDGQEIVIPLDRLSLADQEYLSSLPAELKAP